MEDTFENTANAFKKHITYNKFKYEFVGNKGI